MRLPDRLRLPETLRILGEVWEIEVVPGLVDSSGATDADRHRILVDEDVQAGFGEILLHEICHVLDGAGQLELTHQQVAVLAAGIWAALRDNPALRALLEDPPQERAAEGESGP